MSAKKYPSRAAQQRAYRQRSRAKAALQHLQQEGSAMESAETTCIGKVRIAGVVYEVEPSVDAYEVSKRVYRMLCDFPAKRKRFEELLKACGSEIKDSRLDDEGKVSKAA